MVQRLNASTEAKIERKDTMLVDASDLTTLGVGDGGASGGVEGVGQGFRVCQGRSGYAR